MSLKNKYRNTVFRRTYDRKKVAVSVKAMLIRKDIQVLLRKRVPKCEFQVVSKTVLMKKTEQCSVILHWKNRIEILLTEPRQKSDVFNLEEGKNLIPRNLNQEKFLAEVHSLYQINVINRCFFIKKRSFLSRKSYCLIPGNQHTGTWMMITEILVKQFPGVTNECP